MPFQHDPSVPPVPPSPEDVPAASWLDSVVESTPHRPDLTALVLRRAATVRESGRGFVLVPGEHVFSWDVASEGVPHMYDLEYGVACLGAEDESDAQLELEAQFGPHVRDVFRLGGFDGIVRAAPPKPPEPEPEPTEASRPETPVEVAPETSPEASPASPEASAGLDVDLAVHVGPSDAGTSASTPEKE